MSELPCRYELIRRVAAIPDVKFQEAIRKLRAKADQTYHRGYDLVSALFELERKCKAKNNRPMLYLAREVLATLGFYRKMTPAELELAWQQGGTPWCFRLLGQPYTTDYDLDTMFLDPDAFR